MANRDVFPTENWQWPEHLAPATAWRQHTTAMSHIEAAVNSLKRDLFDWKLVAERRMKERDELVEALERALERSAPEHLLAAVERDELAQDRAILARIKGGG